MPHISVFMYITELYKGSNVEYFWHQVKYYITFTKFEPAWSGVQVLAIVTFVDDNSFSFKLDKNGLELKLKD